MKAAHDWLTKALDDLLRSFVDTMTAEIDWFGRPIPVYVMLLAIELLVLVIAVLFGR